MKNLAMKRMRLQSHSHIKRLITYHQQRLNLLAKTTDRKATCKYNAESAFLLCAVNPSGPCAQCHHYEPKKYHNPI